MVRRVVQLHNSGLREIVGIMDLEAKDIPEVVDGYSLIAIHEHSVIYQEAACISFSPSLVTPHIFMGPS